MNQFLRHLKGVISQKFLQSVDLLCLNLSNLIFFASFFLCYFQKICASKNRFATPSMAVQRSKYISNFKYSFPLISPESGNYGFGFAQRCLIQQRTRNKKKLCLLYLSMPKQFLQYLSKVKAEVRQISGIAKQFHQV